MPLLIGLGVFGFWKTLRICWPALELDLFVAPAARMAAAYLSVPWAVLQDGTWLLALSAGDVRVGHVCSGFGFFTILHAMAAATLHPLTPWKQAIMVLPACYALSVLTNSTRIISTIHARVIGERLVPPQWLVAVHLAVGVFIFVAILTLAYLALTQLREYSLRTS